MKTQDKLIAAEITIAYIEATLQQVDSWKANGCPITDKRVVKIIKNCRGGIDRFKKLK